MRRRYDMVVVGAGLAGLAAACRAAELGLSVAVLEQGTGPDYPCNSRVSSGILHVAGAGPDRPAPELAAALAGQTSGAARPELVRLLAGNAARARDWLVAHRARIERVEVAPGQWQGDVLGPVGYRTPRMEWAGMGPDLLLGRLRDALLRCGGEFHPGCEVVELIHPAGRSAGASAVDGVRARQGGGTGEWPARAVVLADGGFQASPDHLRRYVTAAPERLAQRGAGTGAGTALSLAATAGAALVGLDTFYGHLLSRDALGNDRLCPYPMLDPLAEQGIVVDRLGRRFTDEGHGGVDMANRLARQADPAGAFAVVDSTGWEAAGTGLWPPPPNPTVQQASGTVHRAWTLRELAEAAGIDVRGLMTTVAAYNSAVHSGRLHALDIPRTPKSAAGETTTGTTGPWPRVQGAAEIAVPPFYALPVCPGITFTVGGPLIDAAARVLHAAGGPVHGLYAAGSCVGGFDGGTPVGYAGGLLKAVVTGLAAAEHLAAAPAPAGPRRQRQGPT